MHIVVYGMDPHKFSEATIRKLVTRIMDENNFSERIQQNSELVFIPARCMGLIDPKGSAPIFEIKGDPSEGSRNHTKLAEELKNLGLKALVSSVIAFEP